MEIASVIIIMSPIIRSAVNVYTHMCFLPLIMILQPAFLRCKDEQTDESVVLCTTLHLIFAVTQEVLEFFGVIIITHPHYEAVLLYKGE